jgi:phosphate transport system permease protein
VQPQHPLNRTDRGAVADTAFRWLTLAAGLLVLLILGLIVWSTTRQAWPAFREEGLSFVTSRTWVPNDPDGAGPKTAQFGALAFVYGTVVASTIAVVLSVPVSFGLALFTTELAPRRLRKLLVAVVDLLAAIPSVVYGLWGVAVLAPALVGFYGNLHDTIGRVPVLGRLFGPDPNGRSLMTAGIVLAIMITPIITVVTRDVLRTVPQGEKDAALALGATRWEMIRTAVLPHSFGGMVGAVMLGLGRAMGETIAVALVIGSSPQLVANLFKSGDAMPAVIANQFGESGGTYRAALIGLGVLLFLVTIVVNMSARWAVRRAEVRLRGAA